MRDVDRVYLLCLKSQDDDGTYEVFENDRGLVAGEECISQLDLRFG